MNHTTMPVDARRAQLIAASRDRDPHTFLNAAQDYLHQQPEDAEVLLLAVKAYVALGLASPARRLLQHAALAAETRDQLAALIPTTEQRVPWSRLDRQFQANLEVFDRRTGLGGAVLDVWRAGRSKLQLLKCADGGFEVFSRLPDTPGWLPAFAPHHRLTDAAELTTDWAGMIIPPLAINGLGLGYTVHDVIEASRKTFLDYSALVIVIEPCLLAWAVVLHLFDWRPALAESRVRLCAGPDALARLEHELGDLELAVPRLLTGTPPWPGSCSDRQVCERLEAAQAERSRTQRELYRRVTDSYAACDAAWWARRLARAGESEPPLTVLGVTSRYTTVLQYSMRDWLAAFERLGHRTHLDIEPHEQAHFSPIRLLREIERHRPDLLLIIDHLQGEFPEAYPANIPGICWIQDALPHLFNPDAGRGVRPLEFVVGHGFPEVLTRFEYPADRFYPCLIPTNPEQMRDPDEQSEDLEPCRCDVMFATNASMSAEEQYRWRRKLMDLDEAAARLFDAAYEMLLAAVRQPWFCGDYDYQGLLSKAESDTGLRLTSEAARHQVLATLFSIADVSLRERTVRAAAEWARQTGGRFHLYGNGWEKRAEFAGFARGFVPHGRPLGRAFRAAKISLHAGCNPALHQRVLDGLCAGGFFLFAEKPSDALADVPQAVDRYIAEQHPTLPFQLKPEMLPEPYADRCRRGMRMRGVDPATGTLVTAEHASFLKHCRGLRSIPAVTAIWPRYEQVVFRDGDHLAERVGYFLEHADQRRELADEMRAAVLEHFTYDALVRDVLAFMQRTLAGRGTSLF